MDHDKAFAEIRSNIANGNRQAVLYQMSRLVDGATDEPFVLLKCVSLLKTIGEDSEASAVVEKCIRASKGPSDSFEIARGLRSLGMSDDAVSILSDLPYSDKVARELAYSLFDSKDYKASLDSLSKIAETTVEDDVFRAEVMRSSGDILGALELSESLIRESPDDFEVCKCYCTSLVRVSRQKDADRFVKERLKTKKDVDSLVLNAYLLWLSGKVSAAGGYAAKAVKADQSHVGAMEVMAYCLVEKGKIPEARIVAGAINEKVPGHPAVMRILSMCGQ